MSEHENFENLLQSVYEKILLPGDVAVDIGAHSGRHTLPMYRAISGNQTGKVVAYEPIPVCRDWILHRFKVEGCSTENLEVRPWALSNFSGNSEFIVAVDRPEESGLIERKYNGPTSVQKIQVEVRMLDQVNAEHPVKFIKIDCEGAEFSVLKGGVKTIKSNLPVIAFEFGKASYMAYGVKPLELIEFFNSINYSLYTIKGVELNSTDFINVLDGGKIWDFLAFPSNEWDKKRVATLFR